MKKTTRLAAALCAAALFTPLSHAQDLYVGSNSSGVTTNFTSGTNAYANTFVGYEPGADSNTLNVLNTNTVLTNSGELRVGLGGSGNSLIISNGGTVANGRGYIGFTNTSSNNSVLVTGSNSLWTNTNRLYVGDSGSGNSLVISNGGTVAKLNGYIGDDSTSSNNSVLVTGLGSLFTNSGALYAGYFGSGNSLVISNDGKVAGIWGYIGSGNLSSNNSVLVTDGGTWTNSGNLFVGNLGSGNSLVISNGGTAAVATNGYIGNGTSFSNNSVLVTGPSSLFTNGGDLFVGLRGSGNSLTVADGGTVAAANIVIAASNVSSGTLNLGRFGTNDTGGTIITPTITFGAGTGAINFNQSNSTTLSAAISGNGSVNQRGSGTTTLSASSSYTGATAVSAGQLVVDGSINNSTVTVNNGGTLAGSGSVGGIVLNLGSTINPGNSPGTQSVAGNVVWNAGANYNWQIYDTALAAGTGWDLVNATGTLDLSALTVGSEFNINLWSLQSVAPDANGPALNFDPNQNYTWTILTAAGGISGFTGSNQFAINTGAFNGTAGFANALNGGAFSLAQSGNDLNLVFTAAGGAPIPEPGTCAAAALLVGGAAFLRWRKRAKVA